MQTRVFIVDPSGSKKTTVEVPANVQSQKLIKALVQRMGLPEFGHHERPIAYKLTSIKDGEETEINPERTFEESGIQNDDVLRLYSDMQAGKVFMGRPPLPSLFRKDFEESCIRYDVLLRLSADINPLNQTLSKLRQQRELLMALIESLKQQKILETRSEEISRFEQLITKKETEFQHIEEQLQELELPRYAKIKRGILKIHALRGGAVREIIRFLGDIQNAYENLYAFEFRIEEIKEQNVLKEKFLLPIQEVHKIILPEDRLLINKVKIESPGFWEIFGSLNPLIQIREYLKERHERRKDKEWREEQEHQKMILENTNFKTEILAKQIDLLKKANVPEENIRIFLMTHFYEPLERLEVYQNSMMIESAEIIE